MKNRDTLDPNTAKVKPSKSSGKSKATPSHSQTKPKSHHKAAAPSITDESSIEEEIAASPWVDVAAGLPENKLYDKSNAGPHSERK